MNQELTTLLQEQLEYESNPPEIETVKFGAIPVGAKFHLTDDPYSQVVFTKISPTYSGDSVMTADYITPTGNRVFLSFDDECDVILNSE